MTDKIIIPVIDLENSRKQTISHIETLLKSAQNSIKKKDYAIATGISVLALEEVTKLSILNERIKSKKPVYENDWKALSKHLTKLRMPFKKMSTQLKDKSTFAKLKTVMGKKASDMIDTLAMFATSEEGGVLKTLSNLDKLKQDCFYINQRDSKMFSISTSLSSKEQKLLANWMLNFAKMMFYAYRVASDPSYFKKFANHYISVYINPLRHKNDNAGFMIYDKLYFKNGNSRINYSQSSRF